MLYAAELFSHHTFIACECATDRCDSGSINNKYVHNVIARRRFYMKTKLTTHITCKSIFCGNCFLRFQPLFYHINQSLNQVAEYNSIDLHFVVHLTVSIPIRFGKSFPLFPKIFDTFLNFCFKFYFCYFFFQGKKWVEILLLPLYLTLNFCRKQYLDLCQQLFT